MQANLRQRLLHILRVSRPYERLPIESRQADLSVVRIEQVRSRLLVVLRQQVEVRRAAVIGIHLEKLDEAVVLHISL